MEKTCISSILSPRALRTIDLGALAIVAALISYAWYLVMLVVPNEVRMGAVQRIFYFHVGSAIASYVGVALLLVGAIGYLATHHKAMDLLSEAAAEVAFLFCSIVLLTGMIWARPIWNVWFNWEPRLVSFLLLWLILLSLVVLRSMAEHEGGGDDRVARHAAVLGIVGAITVPIVVYSIQLLPASSQLHPRVLEKNGLRDPRFVQAWAVATFALIALHGYLIWIRFRVGMVREGLNRVPTV